MLAFYNSACFPLKTIKYPSAIRFAQASEPQDLRISADDDTAVRRPVVVGPTGGTIGMQLGEAGTRTFCQKPKSALEKPIFETPVDSSDIDRKLQKNILDWVYGVYGDKQGKQVPGVVITHGTDTMEETAALLAYQQLPMVIVLTGSWSSVGEPDSDAALNLERAKRAAAVIPVQGVYAVIQDQVILASQLHKIQNQPWRSRNRLAQTTLFPNSRIQSGINRHAQNYFVSIHDRILGRFDEQGALTLNPEMIRAQKARWNALPPSEKPRLRPGAISKPAYVEHLIFTQNTSAKVLQDLERRLETVKSPNGAVLEGNWQKRTDAPAIARKVTELAKEQHYVVSTSGPQVLKQQKLVVDNLPGLSLRAKLATLLSQNRNPFELAALSQNLSGEIEAERQPKTPALRVPKAFEQRGELIIANPSLTPQVVLDAVERLKHLRNQTSKPVLLLVGYGDGHIPIGNATECFEQIEKVRQGQVDPSTVRRWLIENRPMLAALAKAIDAGIEVRVGSKGEFLAPKLGAYEIGAVLKFIGAQAIQNANGELCTTQQYLDRF